MSDPSQFLHQAFPPAMFTQHELDQIIAHFKRVTFAKNTFLVRQDTIAKAYWFVESGFLRSFVTNMEGNDITTHFFTPGDICIDWPSFLMRMPTRENIQALTDGVGWQLDFEAFQSLFHGHETFREQGRSRLASSFFSLKQRSIAMIADSAKERYNRLVVEKPQLVQNVSLKHIATYLGITDTSLSRIRKGLAAK